MLFLSEEFLNSAIDRVSEKAEIKTLNGYKIRRDSPILKKLEAEGKIKICGAVYEMSSGKVRFL